MRIVVKLGGHAFPLKLNVDKILKYVTVFKKLCRAGHRLIVVTGGGSYARLYIKTARKLGANETICDLTGIESSRLNARLLIAGLGEDAYPEIPRTIQEIDTAFYSGKIIVLGGLYPGQSTDAVAAVTSELIGASLLIKATDADGIYTMDPKKDPASKKLNEVSCAQLLEMLIHESLWAGEYELLDPIAIKIVDRSKIKTWVIDGRIPANIEKIVKGERTGTLIISSQ